MTNVIQSARKSPYQHGYDCGLNGANTTNCNFAIFNCRENAKEWERGQRDGKAARKAVTK